MREASIHSILRVRVAVRLPLIFHVIWACKLMVLKLDILQPWLLRLGATLSRLRWMSLALSLL